MGYLDNLYEPLYKAIERAVEDGRLNTDDGETAKYFLDIAKDEQKKPTEIKFTEENSRSGLDLISTAINGQSNEKDLTDRLDIIKEVIIRPSSHDN